MRLSDVLKIWEILHRRFGVIRYIDLKDAIENVVGIEKDIQFILREQKVANDKLSSTKKWRMDKSARKKT